MEPYITPQKLLGKLSLPIECKFAFICYCPMPLVFEQFNLGIDLENRYFIHTHNNHVMFCQYGEINFIVVAEVYGGPVSVTTVEELKHYGIDTIIGLGFVGSLYNKYPTGSMIVGEKALIENGTTPHYVLLKYNSISDKYSYPTMKLNLNDININNLNIWTTNALYREYQKDLEMAKENECSVVNMDTSHLYASCDLLNIKCEYYAIVTDVMDQDCEWKNDLTEAVNDNDNDNGSDIIKNQTELVMNILDKLVLI